MKEIETQIFNMYKSSIVAISYFDTSILVRSTEQVIIGELQLFEVRVNAHQW